MNPSLQTLTSEGWKNLCSKVVPLSTDLFHPSLFSVKCISYINQNTKKLRSTTHCNESLCQCSLAYSAGYLTFESLIAVKYLPAVTMPFLPIRPRIVKKVCSLAFLKTYFSKTWMWQRKKIDMSSVSWNNPHSSFITHQPFLHIPFYLLRLWAGKR